MTDQPLHNVDPESVFPSDPSTGGVGLPSFLDDSDLEGSAQAGQTQAPKEASRSQALDTDLPPWALETEEAEETEGASWLMEFEDGEEFDISCAVPPGSEVTADGGEFGGESSGGDSDELLESEAKESRFALQHLVIASISLGLGFAGARYFSSREAVQPPPLEVARVEVAGEALPSKALPSKALPVSPTAFAPQPTPPAALPTTPAIAPEAPAPFAPPKPPGPALAPLADLAATTAPAPITPIVPSIRAAAPKTAPGPTKEVARPWAGRNPRVRFTGPGRRQFLTVVPPFMTLDGRMPRSARQLRAETPEGLVIVGPSGAAPAATLEPTATNVAKAPTVQVEAPTTESGVRTASPEDLAGLWVGGSIPLDRLHSATRLMTPGVGRVRVLLLGGEVFEGDLYAVGESRVWLQSDLGRTALFAWQVESIEHLLSSGSAQRPDGQVLAGEERVRVRTPGGVFYGRLVQKTEDSVTLLTAEGACITLFGGTLDEDTVQPAGKSATHLVDASGVLELDEPLDE
ncbi:MAG TPA: hypothetical protein EYG30_13290 [Planctomycetes bacterium]|nr:hypothetical protein [Planctomycetota bacterium]HIL53215.1 hypothetical protein [Planctomycetota bacterium]